MKPDPDPSGHLDPCKIRISHHLGNFNTKPSDAKNTNKMSLEKYHKFTKEQMLTSRTSHLPTFTQQAQHPSKQAQASTIMTTPTDTSQDSAPPSTPKRNNSDITYKERESKDTFVSPDAGDNKRNKLRFGADPMEEEETGNKNKRSVKNTATLRLLNMTARAAAQKKDGAATPGATPRGMSQFLSTRDTLGAT